MAASNKSSDIKKKAAKKVQSKVKSKVKREVKKEAKKKLKKVTKPNKPEGEEKAKGKQPSAIHQFIPFILFAISLLIAVCLIGAELIGSDMGVAGNFISEIFCGLLGFGAFLLPVVLVYVGIIWFKSVENNNLKSKAIFSLTSVLLLAAIVNVLLSFNKEPSFNVVELWNSGIELSGGGVLGGLISSLMVVMFKSVGAIIILLTCLLISLMFMLSITPKNVVTYIKYRSKLREERKLMLAERMIAEKADEDELEPVKEEKKLDATPEKVRVMKHTPTEEKEKKPADPLEERKTLLDNYCKTVETRQTSVI